MAPTLPEIPPLSLDEFYMTLGLVRYMEPDTEEVMQEAAERAWRGADVARGHYWSSSFHSSEFSGDDPDACPRYLAYRMMDFAPAEPMPPWVTTTGDVGKAIEMSIVSAWYEAGRSLIVPEGLPGGGQLVFALPEYWMTGSVDLPVLKKGWRKPHIIEIKTKDSAVVESMKKLERRYDEAHRRQVLATLGLANGHDWGTVVVCEDSWRLAREDNANQFLAGSGLGERTVACREHGGDSCLIEVELEPPDTASIYYCDRAWPRKTYEYVLKHDPEFMRRGLALLEYVRKCVEEDKIPERPEHFKWSLGSCQYCTFKRHTCKPDFIQKSRREKLSESHGVEHSVSVRGEYDREDVLSRLERWRDD